MPSDIRAQQAREHHALAAVDEASARRHREERDRLIRDLRAELDPDGEHKWKYTDIAKAVRCSPELVAAVVKDRRAVR
jgi:cell division septum initiation protein DivIVA